MNYSRGYPDPERDARDLAFQRSREKLMDERYSSRYSDGRSGTTSSSDRIPDGYIKCGHCNGEGVCARGSGRWSCATCMSKSYFFKREGRAVKCDTCKGFGIVELP